MAAWRASVRPPREDVTGRYHVALAELAGYVHRDVSDLLDEWATRADAYAYDGHVRGEAERLAFEDLVAAVRR